MKPKFDYSKLLGKMKEKGFTAKTFAECLEIGVSTISLKLSNKAYFTQREMNRACEVLGFDKQEMGTYFFTLKV